MVCLSSLCVSGLVSTSSESLRSAMSSMLMCSNYFGPTIYKNLGFGGNTTLMINGISGAWQVVVVWVFIQFIGMS